MQQQPNPYSQFQQPPQQWQQQPNYTQPQTYYPPQSTPQQNKPQQPPQQKPPQSHNNWRWWIGAIISGVIFVSYLLSKSGIQSTSTPSTTTTAPTVIASTATTSTVSNTPAPFTVGEQVSVGYWKVSVNSVKTSHGDNNDTPKQGGIYLVIDVTVINISGSNQLMASGYYFRITDSTGQPYDEKFTSFGGPPEGTIIPNGKLRGQLIYEVPTSEHAFTLQVIGGNTTDSAVAVWSITD